MKTIKLDFYDFGESFNKKNNVFVHKISKRYNVEITPDADYCIYAPFGNEHHRFDGIRIFYTGENVIPNFNYCDYATGFADLNFGDRYFRFPGIEGAYSTLFMRLGSLNDEELLSREFCATVISNVAQTDGVRERILNLLNTYKPVASGGGYRNTEGGRVADKYAFQKQYKFVLAGENVASAGYTTEKLPQAFEAHAIPIYHGDPDVAKYYNPKAFINAADFDSDDALLDYIKKVDADDELYLSILHEPVFVNNKIPYELTEEALLDFYSNIFDQPLYSARRRCFIKAYNDIDYASLKSRDVKSILCSKILRFLSLK